MKVYLATQTLSKSNAIALNLCENEFKLPQFYGSSATANFILMFNNIFDWFNSKSSVTFGVRVPISRENFAKFYDFAVCAKDYICNLKHTNGIPVIQGKRNKAFLGIIILLQTFIYVYRSYVQTNHLECILTYKFSQDHIEHVFGTVRRSLGCNNNPTVIQVECFQFK